MNYSSLVPVLQIVMITVLALIEVAPARTGESPVNEERLEFQELELSKGTARVNGQGRAPKLRMLVSVRDLGEHGYSDTGARGGFEGTRAEGEYESIEYGVLSIGRGITSGGSWQP